MFHKRSYCVVTGASRGLGREIAIQLSREWNQADVHSDVVITARNMEGLQETKALINSQAPAIGVHVVPGDMGDMESLTALCSEILELIDTSKHEQGVLIHNVGTMNAMAPFISRTDPKIIQDYVGINFTSMVVLTNSFLSAFSGGPRYIINISSLFATFYSPGFSLYGASKVARNAFMGMLGAEVPDVRQFSYSPGPCNTDMYRELPENIRSVHPLTTEQSIQKLVDILKDDKYKNSSVIDYFDEI